MELDKNNIETLHGIFKDNIITTDNGEELGCISYGSLRNAMENKLAFFALRWSDDVNNWIVFQYVLDEEVS